MTAVNEPSHSRKRMATYGKAVRKRLPDGITSLERYRSLSQEDPGSPTSSISPVVATLKSVPPPPPHLRSSASSDLLDLPSSNGLEDTNATPKRRKITGEIHLCRENPAHNTPQQQHLIDEPKGSSTTTQNVPTKHGSPSKHLQRISLGPRRLAVPPNGRGSTIGHSTLSSPPSPMTGENGAKVQDQIDRQARKPSPEKGNIAVTVNISKAQLVRRDVSPTPRKLSTPDGTLVSTPVGLTPKGVKMWNGLLEEKCTTELEATESQSIIGGNRYLKDVAGRASSKPSLPRKRLIDSLVKKSRKSIPPRHLSPITGEDQASNQSALILISNDTPHLRGRSTAPAVFEPVPGRAGIESTVVSGSQIPQASGPKITYSRQRSMLAEQDISEKATFNLPLHDGLPHDRRQTRRGSFPLVASLQNLHEIDDADEGQAGVAIRTIHELRQAGAHTRFIDEVEDLLDRIGKLSTRRAGLLDLAQKMKEKEFRDKFLANGMDHQLFPHLGEERDVISGFLILSLLIILLDVGIVPAAHVQRLHVIARLLIHLLDVKDNIADVAKDRKNNMSKSAQMTLSGQVQALLGLRVWEGLQVEIVSPRTVALRCLELMVRQSRESGYTGAIISNELTEKLFCILKLHSSNGSWNLPTGQDLLDTQLTLSTLESHSLNAIMSLDESTLVGFYLPIVRSILESTLRTSSEESKILQILVIRLTLNITNNNPKASDVFATPEVMHTMGQALVTNFSLLTKFMVEEERIKLVDHLILMLGVMMNFAECSVSARRCFHELKDSKHDPLDDLVHIFVENLEKTSEVGLILDSFSC
jgi:Wings apart-like protein regulation of heterochromatin